MRDSYSQLDQADPLAQYRALFDLPEGVIYLDGNSLGPLPKATPGRIQQVLHEEWGTQLIKAWTACNWIDLPARIGGKIARLVGAQPDEVLCADSTSVNVFKALSAALALNPKRRVILSTTDNFPTDLYMAQGLIHQLDKQHELRLVSEDEVSALLTDDVAVLMLTHVNYKTGRMHDMVALTKQAHVCGVLVLWDLAHSAGALPVDLNAAQADFAVGCGYKYLNGGPGAPAFIYVAQRWQNEFRQPLSGWLGDARPFAFDPTYEPANGVGRYMVGTPPLLSLAALECGVDMLLDADMNALRAKSLALGDLFIERVEMKCAVHGLVLATPREHVQRGSQVSYHHPEGYAIMQALIAHGVIGDFRAPDIIRFGFAPLYVSYDDVARAVDILARVLDERLWDAPQFRMRKKVT